MAHHDATAGACHDVHVVSQWLIYMGIDTPNQLCMFFFYQQENWLTLHLSFYFSSNH
jgi:hypothetical protein